MVWSDSRRHLARAFSRTAGSSFPVMKMIGTPVRTMRRCSSNPSIPGIWKSAITHTGTNKIADDSESRNASPLEKSLCLYLDGVKQSLEGAASPSRPAPLSSSTPGDQRTGGAAANKLRKNTMIICPMGTSASIERCSARPCERPMKAAASTVGDSGGTLSNLAKICPIQ